MAERRWPHFARWGLLAVAALTLVLFLTQQAQQNAQVSYAQSPSSDKSVHNETSGTNGATVPSVDQMKAMVQASPVVRLPGAVAVWDEAAVRKAIGNADIRILVAPPGIDKDAGKRVSDVSDASVTIVGLEVSADMGTASADDASVWQRQFGTADVTNEMLTMIAAVRHQPSPPDVPPLPRREPTAAELATATASLRATGRYRAPGSTLADPPATTNAFPGKPLYVALPTQPAGRPLVHYGPALAREFPGRPIVVMYGGWIEYDGPSAAEFTDVATAGFYGQFGDFLSPRSYPQDGLLGAYLSEVTDIRYAGIFDHPLPYVPFDPLHVTLPALPWVFAACAVGFLAFSIRPALRRSRPPAQAGVPARLAGLTALAVEVSGLTDGPSDAALARGITDLTAARHAFDRNLDERLIRASLDSAQSELDTVAELLGRDDYRPAHYLPGSLA
ncbi:hypothetical protein [Amycolatopsis saalfeldensis]|uniref:DUF4350 domain-containing protein n=1 Tax=Amycolatopsis saalfeldensis TaxID=394193 RepID=A0A1H8Y9F5_9PSEU|nr:hypothetical protein [Amycolatopsis saalfeldensis]SEP48621.1 hypothetical protein SAMN04489732_11289 [Amycolatopsis saalfeldensis]